MAWEEPAFKELKSGLDGAVQDGTRPHAEQLMRHAKQCRMEGRITPTQQKTLRRIFNEKFK